MRNAPLVSVGIPTYNRPLGLRRTLSCITAQSYQHLEIVVSDNCSSDPGVAVVVQELSRQDHRIRPFRQTTNLGVYNNFRYVLSKSQGTYFMWAADDDEWEPTFVEELVALLEKYCDVGVAFSNFDARDATGRRIPAYPDFLPLLEQYASKPVAERLTAYIGQEESLGKANVIYGLFRKDLLISTREICAWGPGKWGFDMLIVCSVLARSNLKVSPNLLYHVGVETVPPDSAQKIATSEPPCRAIRIARSVMLHFRYMFGYTRIVWRTSSLSIAERILLISRICKRFGVLARRDLTKA